MGAIGDAIGGAFKGVAGAVEGAVGSVVHTVEDVGTGNFGNLPGDVLGDVIGFASLSNPELLAVQGAASSLASDIAPPGSDASSALGAAAQVAQAL